MKETCLAEFATNYEFTKAKKPDHALQGTSSQRSPTADESDLESEDELNLIDKQLEISTQSQSVKLELVDGSGSVKKKRSQKILRFRHYGKAEDPKNYSREQLMLFVPWRNEQSDLLEIDTIQRALEYEELILMNSQPYYHNREIDDIFLGNAVDEAEEEIMANENIVENEFELEDEEAADQYFHDAKSTSKSRVEQFRPPRLINEEDYLKIMRTLNDKQQRLVLESLHRLKTSSVPFYAFLSGGAGVGKSHAVTAIVQSFLRFLGLFPTTNPDEIGIIVAAPTGKASFNVGGMTLHGSFRLPPTQYSGKLADLDEGVANSLRIKFRKTKAFIIDEISMVSCGALYHIDQRLRQIYCTSEDFGGKSILAVGHLRQLPPVAADYVFQPNKKLACVGNHLWEKFSLFEFDEVMRQKGEFEFCKALNNMSEGCMDEEDILLIKSREIHSKEDATPEAIWLFTTNVECQSHNNHVHENFEKLDAGGSDTIAHDKVQGQSPESDKKAWLEYAKTLKPTDSDGMPYKTRLQPGGEYFVSTNIDVPDGLFNGATGTLMKIDFGKTKNKVQVPKRAWLDFRNPLIGTSKRRETEAQQVKSNIPLEWTAIEQITRSLSKARRHGLELIRTQIPLIAANGMTINKSQGSSLKCVVLGLFDDQKNRQREISRALLYVACSRATSRNGLFIYGDFKAPAPPGPQDLVTIEMDRLRRTPFQFKLRFLQDYDASYTKLFYHNVQSIIAHFQDVKANHCAISSDVLAFVEPILISSDLIEFPGYDCCHRTNCRQVRNSEGVIIFQRVKESDNEQDAVSEATIETNIPSGDRGHCFFVKLKMSGVTAVTMYKSPKYSSVQFQKKLSDLLENLAGKCVLFGDININLLKPEGQRIVNILENAGYESKLSLQDSSTNFSTHIDCCFANFEGIQAWFFESYYSYHKPICVIWPKNM